jgi:microcystin-dependent protein
MSRNYTSIAEPKTLSGDITNTATQLTLNNVTGLPSPPYVLVLSPDTASEEAVLVVADGTLTAPTIRIQRAIETGATAYPHTNGNAVRHMIVGSDLQFVHDHLDDSDLVHGIGSAEGNVVGTAKAQTLTNKTLTTPKINENVNLTATSTELNILDGATLTTTELNYVDGVTSAVQTQLNTKAPSADPTFTGTVVLPSTTSIGTVTSTEIGYLDGVTSAIQTQFTNNTPVGAVNMWVTDTAPTGWLLCDGTEKLVSSYPTLANVIGTNYGALTNGSGGAGTTHFRVPDLRGRVPMGIGTGTTVDHNNALTARSFNATNRSKVSNDETVTLTEAQMPSHNHALARATKTIGTVGSDVYDVIPVGDFAAQDATDYRGSSQAHNNTQPSTVINFIIKF